MKDKLVGVLGASGKIGYNACLKLNDFCRIRGGHRRENKELASLDNYEWVKVDLNNLDELKSFCEGCDVVLNCAGPAYKIKDRVAKASAEAGAVYVDASDILMVNKEASKELNRDAVYILASGYVPGLSAVIPRIIASNEFDKVEKLYCFQGGKQSFSAIAFTDIILSSITKSGYSDSYYSHGEIVKDVLKLGEKVSVPGFKDSVFLKAYLSSEMKELADELGIGELHWYNMVSDESMMALVMDSFQLIMTNEREEAINKIQEKCEKTFKNVKTENEWSCIRYEFYGEKNNKKIHRTVMYTLDKEEVVCGEISAETVKAVLKNKPENGMYWANEVFKNMNQNEISALANEDKLIISDSDDQWIKKIVNAN